MTQLLSDKVDSKTQRQQKQRVCLTISVSLSEIGKSYKHLRTSQAHKIREAEGTELKREIGKSVMTRGPSARSRDGKSSQDGAETGALLVQKGAAALGICLAVLKRLNGTIR